MCPVIGWAFFGYNAIIFASALISSLEDSGSRTTALEKSGVDSKTICDIQVDTSIRSKL